MRHHCRTSLAFAPSKATFLFPFSSEQETLSAEALLKVSLLSLHPTAPNTEQPT
jgi:hypothetical protein